MPRPTRDEAFMETAWVWSKRSTCGRRAVGAVLVRDNHVVSTGYNGSPPGLDHCSDAGCLMHEGNCIRTIHAELNAIIHAAAPGDTLYCTDTPCLNCYKAALTHGIRRIVWDREYVDPAREAFIASTGVNILERFVHVQV